MCVCEGERELCLCFLLTLSFYLSLSSLLLNTHVKDTCPWAIHLHMKCRNKRPSTSEVSKELRYQMNVLQLFLSSSNAILHSAHPLGPLSSDTSASVKRERKMSGKQKKQQHQTRYVGGEEICNLSDTAGTGALVLSALVH